MVVPITVICESALSIVTKGCKKALLEVVYVFFKPEGCSKVSHSFAGIVKRQCILPF
jgi:hypothetical protein